MPCLQVKDVSAGYGRIKVIRKINLEVQRGKITLLIGPNGSGKSTLAKAILGLVPVLKGNILFEGEQIGHLPTEKVVKKGIGFVPESRHLFWNMSVEENLLAAGTTRTNSRLNERIREVYELFPVLKERSFQMARTLSGGEQQMLAIGRALIINSQLLILDEPCNGIAPTIVDKIFEVAIYLKGQGRAIFLIDQNTEAIGIADYIYIMRTGKIIARKEGAEIPAEKDMRRLLLA